jgi:hypothetical protein
MNKRIQSLALGALCLAYAVKGAVGIASWVAAKAL